MAAPPPGLDVRPRACPLCASDEGTEVAPANIHSDRLDGFAFASRKRPEYMHHRLVLCPKCDLLYANPAPTPASLEEAYRDAAFASAEESGHASVTYAALLDQFRAGLPAGGGALDIGTGDGAFLKRLVERGFGGVVGVEPSAAPIDAAEPAVRDLIRYGPFDPSTFPASSFRLVTCFQTLEHVADPLELATSVHGLLAPGGAFFAVCHNRRAPVNRALGRRSPIYDIEHLQLFCPASLRALFERAGFTRVDVFGITNRYPVRYWLRLTPIPEAVKARVLAAADRGRAGRVMVSLPVGNLAAVGYRHDTL